MREAAAKAQGRPDYKGRRVIAKDGTEGFATGSTRRCQLEGCLGVRLAVRWADSQRLTYPCTKGLQELEGGVLQMLA